MEREVHATLKANVRRLTIGNADTSYTVQIHAYMSGMITCRHIYLFCTFMHSWISEDFILFQYLKSNSSILVSLACLALQKLFGHVLYLSIDCIHNGSCLEIYFPTSKSLFPLVSDPREAG